MLDSNHTRYRATVEPRPTIFKDAEDKGGGAFSEGTVHRMEIRMTTELYGESIRACHDGVLYPN